MVTRLARSIRLTSRRPRSLATDLLLLCGAIFAPLLLLSAYLSYQNVQESRAAIYETALFQARETAQRADQLVAETQALLTALAETQALRSGDAGQSRQLLRDVQQRFPYYDDLFVIDPAGMIYASAAGPSGENINVAAQQYFQRAIRSDTLSVSEALLSPITGRPVVIVGLPLQRQESGGSRGEVAAALDLITLQRWLTDQTLGAGTTVTVVDRQGVVLARSLEPEQWVGRSIGNVPVVRTAIERDTGLVDGANVDGIERLNGFATAERVPWSVLVGIPGEAVYAPLRQEIGWTVARLGLVALAASVLALVVGRRIVRPVRLLTSGARLIASGDRVYRIDLHRDDELGQLAVAMNQMTDDLVGSIAALQGAQDRLVTAVAQVGRALTSTVEPSALLTPLVEAASALAQADGALLAFGNGAAPVATDGLPLPHSPVLGELLRCAATDDQTQAIRSETVPQGAGVASMHEHLAVAVSAHGELLGVLVVLRREPRPFSAGDEQLLHTFADQAAIAIEQARLRAVVAQSEAVRELNRLQSDFLTTASHELRAPIAGIKSYAELLLRDDLAIDAATRRECLVGINRLSERLAAQVRAFFDTMRVGKVPLELRREPVELGSLATTVVHSFAARSEQHPIELLVAPDLPLALAEPDRVEAVFTNLLDNAIKYSPAGGTITVQIAAMGATEEFGDRVAVNAQLLVSIRDEGIGIPFEEQERIFERFYRLDRAITRNAGGAGLGLYLCRAYVEGMGGSLWVESQPGGGSTFFFTLPTAPSHDAEKGVAEGLPR